MKFNGIIEKKLNVLYETLDKLKNFENKTVNEITNNYFILKGLERSLQICSEVLIDIAHRIVSLKNERASDSATASLEQLEKLGVIKSAATYKPIVQFRNFLVHRYESIDPQIIFNILTKNLDSYYNFAKEIENYEKD